MALANNINRRTSDAVNPPAKIVDNRMASKITMLVSGLLYNISYDTRDGLPCTFYRDDLYFNHYGSNVSSAGWARVRIRAPDPGLGSLLGQNMGYRNLSTSS
jgi:hypothetical protein